MFKKLDKLVVKAFIGPFIAVFFITLLVLIMQFFWLYIDDFVGKGIETKVIFEFILYQSAVLIPLALPLAILLSSLMTFGSLSENYELVIHFPLDKWNNSAAMLLHYFNLLVELLNIRHRDGEIVP